MMKRLWRFVFLVGLVLASFLVSTPLTANAVRGQVADSAAATAASVDGNGAHTRAVGYCSLSHGGTTVHARWSNLFGKIEWLHVWASPYNPAHLYRGSTYANKTKLKLQIYSGPSWHNAQLIVERSCS